MTRKLLGVWFHLEKNVQGGPATIGGSRTMKYTGRRVIDFAGKTNSNCLEQNFFVAAIESKEITRIDRKMISFICLAEQ